PPAPEVQHPHPGPQVQNLREPLGEPQRVSPAADPGEDPLRVVGRGAGEPRAGEPFVHRGAPHGNPESRRTFWAPRIAAGRVRPPTHSGSRAGGSPRPVREPPAAVRPSPDGVGAGRTWRATRAGLGSPRYLFARAAASSPAPPAGGVCVLDTHV